MKPLTIADKADLLRSCIGEHITVCFLVHRNFQTQFTGVLEPHVRQPAKGSKHAADGPLWMVRRGRDFLTFQTAQMEDRDHKMTCIFVKPDNQQDQ